MAVGPDRRLEERSFIWPHQPCLPRPSVLHLWKERKHRHLLQSLSNISCFLKKKKKKIAGPFCHFLALRWHHTSYLSLSFFICKPRQLIPPSSVFVRMKERNVSKAYAHCLTQRNGSTVTALTGGDGDGVERSGLWAALGRL